MTDEIRLELDVDETQDQGKEYIYYATPRQLMWWQFRKHKAALIAIVVLGLMYFFAIFADMVTPYGIMDRFGEYDNSPPTRIHFRDEEGVWHGPFIYRLKRTLDPETIAVVFEEDTSEIYPIQFFVQREPRKILGLVPINWRLFGIEGKDAPPVFLFGADKLGRDLFSRTAL